MVGDQPAGMRTPGGHPHNLQAKGWWPSPPRKQTSSPASATSLKKCTFRDKSAMFIMEGMIYNPISQAMHALTLVLNLIDILPPFFTASLQLFFHDWENETFCVKCGLNADHFSSLVHMRPKLQLRNYLEAL